MTLRRKMLALVAVALVCMATLLHTLQRTLVVRTFALVESQDTERNVQRALRVVEREVRGLDRLTQDWATRDDTYAFVQDGNLAYIQNNLTDQAFADLRLSLVLAVNGEGKAVFSRALQTPGVPMLIPEFAPEGLRLQNPLLDSVRARGATSGVVLLTQGPMLISAWPIPPQGTAGAPRGVLVMGRWLDAQVLAEVGEVSQLSLSLERTDSRELPDDFALALPALATASIWVHPLDDGRVGGYGRLDDVYGRPALILRVDLPRRIYQSGMAAIPYLNWGTVALVPPYCLAVLWVWERKVLRRINELGSQVNRLGETGDLSARVTLDGQDELNALAQRINGMLAQLERAGDAMHQRAAHMHGLARAAETLLASDDGIPYQDFLEELGSLLHADRAYLFLNHHGLSRQSAMHLAAEWCHEGVAPAMGDANLRATQQPEAEIARWVDTLSSGQVVSYLASQLPAEEQASLARRSAQALLVVPVMVHDALEGVLGLERCQAAAAWEAPDVDSARIAAADLGQTLKRQRDESVQRAIYRISEAAHSVQSLQELFAAIHGIVSELMPARNFYIALYDTHAADGLLEFSYFVDEYDEPPPPKEVGRGLTEYVLRTGQPLLADPARFEELVACGEVDSIGAPSIDWLGVPLKIHDRTIGVLVVQTYTAGVRYGEQDKRILMFVSEQVAMAIERKRTEQALKCSEETYRTVFETTGAATAIIEEDMTVSLANRQFQRLTDRPINEVQGRMKWTALLDDPVERQRMESYHRARRNNSNGDAPPRDYEFHWRDSRGNPRNILITVDMIPGTRQSVASVLDITERRRAEENQRKLEGQLRQSQKMSAMGQLAGGVAHDFNNLLTVVLGNAEMALVDMQPDAPLFRELSIIERAARRGAALTQQLLAFSRRQVLQHEQLDINDLLASFSRLLERLIGLDITLKLRLSPDVGRVHGDAAALDQVWMNLAVNARDAMPKGGTLSIETDAVSVDEAFLRDHPAALADGAREAPTAGPGIPGAEHKPVPTGSYVRISVTDTGVGMDAEMRSHLFEPFFTTKQVGKGTGLGLSVVYGIVQQHAGWIEVSSEPGVGTRFDVYLPANGAQATADEGMTEVGE